jgi:hypothetical protein
MLPKAEQFLKKLLRYILGYPVESVAFFLVTTCICYLSLILSSSTPALPLLAFSNGSLYTAHSSDIHTKDYIVFLKQVVISLPKAHAAVSTHGILSPPVLDSLAYLQSGILNDIHLSGEGGFKIKYKDLCWNQNGSCAIYSPLESIFSSYPEVNPIEAVAESLAKNPVLVEYGMEGLVTTCELDAPCSDANVIKADSLVMTLFFNFTTPKQQQLVRGWERRLGAFRTDQFYSPDLSLYFEKIESDGSVSYDIFDAWKQLRNLFRVS